MNPFDKKSNLLFCVKKFLTKLVAYIVCSLLVIYIINDIFKNNIYNILKNNIIIVVVIILFFIIKQFYYYSIIYKRLNFRRELFCIEYEEKDIESQLEQCESYIEHITIAIQTLETKLSLLKSFSPTSIAIFILGLSINTPIVKNQFIYYISIIFIGVFILIIYKLYDTFTWLRLNRISLTDIKSLSRKISKSIEKRSK